MFILPDKIYSTLKKIEDALFTATLEKSFIPLKKYIKRGKAGLVKQRKFTITISDLTRHLQHYLAQQTVATINCFITINTPCDRATLSFYATIVIPAWKEMLNGNILPLCNNFFQLKTTPALLSLTSSLLLFVDKDKINKDKLENIKIEQAQFYIKQLLDDNILIETLEDAII